ncbi:ATP:ADP antiporter, AAA family [Nematocida displodere]|uniref:ADP,ATP carrier protein n=1 Tax=Nematocida displodere TaxID=1805483 RepID=A0A177EE88_9MICR|nr:ATP:ADP antiporter, AAA family [Nematocida displodere]
MQAAGLSNDYRTRSLPTEEAHEEAAEGCSSFFKVLRVEYAKFFSMTFLYFCIVLAYSILRDTKDAVVISRMLPASIQYLKSFIVIAVTMIFAVFFQYLLSKGITLEKIMFALNIGFGVFFLIYAFVLLPTVNYIEPYHFWINDMFSDKKMFVVGLEFLKGLLLTANFWTGTLLYITAELWGNVMTSLMFFAIANEICPLRQALRFYPFFIMAANFGLMTSGGLMVGNSYLLDWFPERQMLIVGILIFCVSCICVVNIFTYRYLVTNIIPYPIYILSENQRRKAKKEKVGMLDGFKVMLKTPIVFHLSMTVLGYGICTNLTESSYKSSMLISSLKSSSSAMTVVMRTQGMQQVVIGACVIAVLLTPLKRLIQKKGWLALGMITPVCTMVSALVFLLFIWSNVSAAAVGKNAENILIRVGKPLFATIGMGGYPSIEIWIGFFAVNTIKILKYAAFDICKEAIGVKIPKQYQARFKGVYDGVFGKLGKAFASNMQIFLLFLFNTSDIRTASPILATAVAIVAVTWCFSTLYLGGKYDEAIREDRDIHIGEIADKSQAQKEKELAAAQ